MNPFWDLVSRLKVSRRLRKSRTKDTNTSTSSDVTYPSTPIDQTYSDYVELFTNDEPELAVLDRDEQNRGRPTSTHEWREQHTDVARKTCLDDDIYDQASRAQTKTAEVAMQLGAYRSPPTLENDEIVAWRGREHGQSPTRCRRRRLERNTSTKSLSLDDCNTRMAELMVEEHRQKVSMPEEAGDLY